MTTVPRRSVDDRARRDVSAVEKPALPNQVFTSALASTRSPEEASRSPPAQRASGSPVVPPVGPHGNVPTKPGGQPLGCAQPRAGALGCRQIGGERLSAGVGEYVPYATPRCRCRDTARDIRTSRPESPGGKELFTAPDHRPGCQPDLSRRKRGEPHRRQRQAVRGEERPLIDGSSQFRKSRSHGHVVQPRRSRGRQLGQSSPRAHEACVGEHLTGVGRTPTAQPLDGAYASDRQCARGPVVALPPGSMPPERLSDRPLRNGS